MKINQKREPVEIEGQVVYVHDWATWLAVDENNDLYECGKKPCLAMLYDKHYLSFGSTAKVCFIHNVDLEGTDWRECLYEIKEVEYEIE